MYQGIAEELAENFRENPLDYVAEADLQISLVELLRSRLSPPTSVADGISLEGVGDDSFKREYPQTIERKLTQNGQLNRVHAEVSVKKGERLDAAVFRHELTEDIRWVSGGSKRFSEGDIEAAYELKFVKNKTSFPKHPGNSVDELAEDEPSVEGILQREGSDDPLLDFDENKIRADIRELNELQEVENRFLLIFSNNNYLYHNPTPMEKSSYRYGEVYHKMGRAARRWMKREANDPVGILYVHPRGQTWISEQ